MSSDSVVISSVSFPDPTTLALVADIQYHEPYVSAGLNRKLRGILKEGFYTGFLPRLGGGLALMITSEGAEGNTGTASVNIGDDYQITIRQQKDVTLQLSAGTKFAIVLKGVYTLGADTYQVNSKSNIQAAEITAKTYTDSYALGEGELLICTVNVPAGATELTDDMIDSTGKNVATIGIELSNDFESKEEKKAATPKAVSDGIKNHEEKDNPHDQYLMIANFLKEISDQGDAAIQKVLDNLRLDEIAKIGVGNGAASPAGYMTIPVMIFGMRVEFIIQWGTVEAKSSGASFLYPIAFPNNVLWIIPGVTNGTVPCSCSISTHNETGGTIYSSVSKANISWIAIGY